MFHQKKYVCCRELDTEETMQILTEQNSFFVTASILEVPPEILDFKWRMLKYYGYLSGQSPISINSDCLKKLQLRGTLNDCI